MKRGDEERKRKHKQKLVDLQQKAHRQIDYHLQKAYVDAGDFYHITQGFFLELLDKKYEPTYEEIITDLENLEHEFLNLSKGQREKAKMLLNTLSESEYTGQELTQEKARQILEAFKDLVTDITTHREGTIDHALHQGFVRIGDNDKKGALDSYSQARQLYDTLDEQQKKIYYEDLQKLYQSVNS